MALKAISGTFLKIAPEGEKHKAVVAEVDWQAQQLHSSEKEAVILALP
jgi:hypothetical protein